MRVLAIVGCVAMGCAPDVIETERVTFDPVCGDDRPVELLALAEDEQLGWIDPLGPSDGLFLKTIEIDEDGLPSEYPPREIQHVVVDRCGEQIVDVVAELLTMTRLDDVLVGCTFDGDLVQLSDASDPSPRVLAHRGCGVNSTSQGHVTFDVDPETSTGRLVALRTSGSEVTVSTLFDGVYVPEDPRAMQYPRVIDDRIFLRAPDLRLVSVDAATGESRVEVDAVADFSATAEFVLYRPPTLDPEDPSPVYLRDRATGTDELLEPALPADWSARLAATSNVVVFTEPGAIQTPSRWFRMNPAREVVPPEDMTIVAVRADGLVWLRRIDATTGELELLRWREGETPESAMKCRDCVRVGGWNGASIAVREQTRHLDRFNLWRLDDAGGAPRMIGNSIGEEYVELEGDRVLTVLGTGGKKDGSLVLYDGAGADGTVLAEEVSWRTVVWTTYAEPGEIFYESRAGDGGHALYRAVLSAGE